MPFRQWQQGLVSATTGPGPPPTSIPRPKPAVASSPVVLCLRPQSAVSRGDCGGREGRPAAALRRTSLPSRPYVNHPNRNCPHGACFLQMHEGSDIRLMTPKPLAPPAAAGRTQAEREVSAVLPSVSAASQRPGAAAPHVRRAEDRFLQSPDMKIKLSSPLGT